jgi:hypothetical protein
MKKYEITFNLGWRSYEVEEESEERAIEQARLELSSDANYNVQGFVQEITVEVKK